MSEKTNKKSFDLRENGNLTVDTITGITDIVEALHAKIISLGGLLNTADNNRTKGITGMVYRIIRSLTKLFGGGVDALLDKLIVELKTKESSFGREAVLSALNGVLGDYLITKNNTLAIPMTFRKDGKPANIQTIANELKQSDGKLLLLVHGSCMNDLQWNRQEHNHGEALAKEMGFVPIYLHYNTGLHVSENGRAFSLQIETLMKQLPQTSELFILGHSMGGLITRSACYYAQTNNNAWLKSLKKIVFLGTPHHGAPLEKGGNWIDLILDANPYSAPFSRLGKIRSCGITDMRYGNITDQDWTGRDRFKDQGDARIPVPLPQNVVCYTIAATLAKESSKIGDKLIGDGLVTLESALGKHKNSAFNLAFPVENQRIIRNIGHTDLLNNSEVYKIIKEWIS